MERKIKEVKCLKEKCTMRIAIIRHGKVNMKWPKKCSSAEFDKACSEYDFCDIEAVNPVSIENQAEKIYVSQLSRSINTARGLFPDREYCEMPELGEVPLKSFKDTDKNLPLWVWNVCGRVQWFIGNHRQLEGRADTIRRANNVIDICEQENVDCVLVTHGFFMKTLLKVLQKRGYKLFGNKRIKVENLQMIWAEKQEE